MSLERSGLVLLNRMSMLMFLTSVSVLVILSSGALMIFMARIFVGLLMLIWSILMAECISKLRVHNRLNH